MRVKIAQRIHKGILQGIYPPVDQRRHLIAIRNMQPNRDNTFEHDYLYACLSILDTKVQGLLTYVAILVGANTIVLAQLPETVTLGTVLVFTSLVLSAISGALCLYVIWVYWTDTIEFEKSSELFVKLLQIRNRRTLSYRIGWITTNASTFLLVLGILLQRRL